MFRIFLTTSVAALTFAASAKERPPSTSPRLYRLVLPVTDIERAARFYGQLLDRDGERVSPGRHYFHTGEVILALVDPRADGDDRDARANQDYIYFAVDDLENLYERATALGLARKVGPIEKRPWGEVSFYMTDPFGNPLCFVDETTLFTGRQK